MNVLADYVQPLTYWLQENPRWALFITFIVSLTESLAIIGSVIPGSVTMTAIGILAGSGIMRIDLTLFAAVLGAIFGDSLSYALGYCYSERLAEIWPFSKYPNWIKYGKEFFSRHGGKSVLIGRFVGPLRSIIPVVAGIMHMAQWRFLVANVLSAIGWALLYVMPGVLIGAVGHELSTESATRLFLLILILLAGAWAASVFLKWLFIKLHAFLKRNLHAFWLKMEHYPYLHRVYCFFTPEYEKNHYRTAGLLLLLLSGLICLTLLIAQPAWLTWINLPIHLFLQSIHTPALNAFFISCNQLTSPLTLGTLFFLYCFWFSYHGQTKTIFYLLSLIGFAALAGLLSHFIASPRPPGLQLRMPGSSFPAVHLEIATAMYGFILLYINSQYSLLTNTLRTLILVMLSLCGLAEIYLGDHWFTDILAAYFIGAIICLIHWLIYRKSHQTAIKKTHSTMMLLSLLAGVLLSTATSTYFNFKTLAHNHAPYHKECTLSESTWWNQQYPILPLYRLNRIGKKISLLNIQFSGELDVLQKHLERNGWTTHTESFFTKLAMRVSRKPNEIKLPLLSQLYENKRPELTMTYEDPQSHFILELSIWESNYTLDELNRPLWIGSIHLNTPKGSMNTLAKPINFLTYLMPILSDFTLRRIKLSPDKIQTSLYPVAPYILLIKPRD